MTLSENKKLGVLISRAHMREKISDSYKTLIINLSDIELTLEESKQLNLGLEYSFVDKNTDIKKFLAANFESMADRIIDNLQSDSGKTSMNIYAHMYISSLKVSIQQQTTLTNI